MRTKSTLTAIVVILAAASAGYLYYQNSQAPDLGVDQGRLKPLGDRPNDISSQTPIVAKRVEPLPFKETTSETKAALKSAVNSYGGGEIAEETDDYLYVVFTTPVLKFHDDLEFWLDQDEQVVHVRSASRAGYSDRGLNRRRYEKLSEYYLGRVSE